MRNPLIFIGLAVILVCSCSETTTTQRQEAIAENRFEATDLDTFIKPPITGLEPPYATFTLNASKGATFRLPTGSEIVVPADAVADKDGKILRGSVKLLYREMHDAISVFLAGIPMQYKGGSFSTAGSFDLRCATDGAYLVKPVAVKMASFTEGFDYNFFYLNEKNRQWDSIGTRRPTINSIKLKLTQKVENERFALGFPLNRQYFAFNYLSIVDVFYNDDWRILGSENTTDSAFAAISEKLKAYGLGWESSYCDNNEMIEWEGASYPAALFVWKNLDQVEFPYWAKKSYGKLIKSGENRYTYFVENHRDSAVFEARLEAVMPLKSLFAFEPEVWKNRYAATLQRVKEESERARKMANLYRSFEVKNFGLYNWDKLMKAENAVVLEANFDFPVNINKKLTTLNVVYISGDNKSVITFTPESWDKLALVPDAGGRLFSILPGNRIALFSNDKYSRLDFERWRKQQTPQYFFELEDKNIIKTEADLRRILNI